MSDAADWMQVLTLPCGRERHARCAGEISLGVAVFERTHTCICPCHAGVAARRHPAYGAHRSVELLEPTPA